MQRTNQHFSGEMQLQGQYWGGGMKVQITGYEIGRKDAQDEEYSQYSVVIVNGL